MKNCQTNLIVEQTNMPEIREIQYNWQQPSSNLKILICEESMSKFLEIDNAQAIIHYDFPSSKTIFGDRLWFMRKHFNSLKEGSTAARSPPCEGLERDLNDNILMDTKSAVEDLEIKYANEVCNDSRPNWIIIRVI